METSFSCGADARAAQYTLDFQKLRFVGGPDAAFEPVVDVGLGELPFSAHLAAGKLSAVRQLGHLVGRQVEITGEPLQIEIAMRHGNMVAYRAAIVK